MCKLEECLQESQGSNLGHHPLQVSRPIEPILPVWNCNFETSLMNKYSLGNEKWSLWNWCPLAKKISKRIWPSAMKNYLKECNNSYCKLKGFWEKWTSPRFSSCERFSAPGPSTFVLYKQVAMFHGKEWWCLYRPEAWV